MVNSIFDNQLPNNICYFYIIKKKKILAKFAEKKKIAKKKPKNNDRNFLNEFHFRD